MMNLLITVFLANTQVVTLDQAVQIAAKNQPQLLAAHANTDVAYARAGEARAPLLPQVGGTATYTRSTSNQTPGAAAVAGFGGGAGAASANESWNTLNQWKFGITASQTLWDGTGQLARWRSNVATAEGVEATERATKLSVTLTVRSSYFTAVADKALVGVARDTLTNQDKHLQQTDGQVKVGTQPEIALATARTNVANARVQLIQAENNYEVAKATLNQSMGVERDTGYDVADESIGPVAGEDQPIEPLLNEALQTRPEFVSLDKQVKAQELAIWAAKTAYGPTVSAQTGFTEGGVELNNMAWNWTFQLGVSWQLFQGGLTWYTVKEQKATLDGVRANLELVRQQTRLQVEQARLAVKASKVAVVAAEEAVVNAKEQLRLAEGRYTAGVGSIIELGDAQVAYTTAAAQKVQADFNVSTARAQLVQALGRN